MRHFMGQLTQIARMSTILDGKTLANEVRKRVKEGIKATQEKFPDYKPHLAVVQVGSREDSSVYLRMKQRAAKETGIGFTLEQLPESISEQALLNRIRELNKDTKVHGMIVQMPLPPHINESTVIETIDYHKDVDGFHALNVGRMAKKSTTPLFLPCTPKGIIELLRSNDISLSGKNAVVVGRSDIVGSPVASLLTAENATVTLCHSKTENIESIVNRADVLVVAIGQPEFIKGTWIKPGAVVIDVGINSVADPSKASGKKLVGDVEYETASKVAGAITPVPGGVGPMTVAMLMENTMTSANRTLECNHKDTRGEEKLRPFFSFRLFSKRYQLCTSEETHQK
ncbi:c-1-tetrahydrofolate synthase [Phycomyces nitens]|nr:c-1-tetrahydrofolate synthase [Phycomyces nitens]